jgi:hypothetical protein
MRVLNQLNHPIVKLLDQTGTTLYVATEFVTTVDREQLRSVR